MAYDFESLPEEERKYLMAAYWCAMNANYWPQDVTFGLSPTGTCALSRGDVTYAWDVLDFFCGTLGSQLWAWRSQNGLCPVTGFPRGSAGAILGSSNQVVNGGPVIPVVTVTLARHDEFIGTLARHDESKMARNIIVNRPEKKAKKKKA